MKHGSYPQRCFTATAAIISLVCISSCNEKKTHRKQTQEPTVNSDSPISLSALIGNEQSYDGKVLAISGILFTHEEGPWLAANWKYSETNILPLIITEDSRLITPPELDNAWWFTANQKESANGYQAVVTGILKIQFRQKPIGEAVKEPTLQVLSAKISAIKLND